MRSNQVRRFFLRRLASSACLLALTALAARLNAQYTFTSIAQFGANTYSNGSLVEDASGNLYGTSYNGGPANDGFVFELVKNAGSYTSVILYNFSGSTDGAFPQGGLVMDASGNLYGTTSSAGSANNGTVYELKNSGGAFSFQVLAPFTDVSGGAPMGELIFDAAGNLYGTTSGRGQYGYGTVFQLANNGGGSYTLNPLYNFAAGPGGEVPQAGLIMDSQGNLYGTASFGGAYGNGTVFELANNGGGSYTFNVLHAFTGADGAIPLGALALDSGGNLYGTTGNSGAKGYGTVFELVNTSGSYTLNTLWSFPQMTNDGEYPEGGVVLDASGNIFSTTSGGGASTWGTVFELVKSSGGYSENILYSFPASGANSPGFFKPLLDHAGNLFGVTSYNDLTVWELASPNIATSLSLTSSANPIFIGDTTTFIATLSSSSSSPLQGSVTFFAGSTALGTVALANNSAALTVAASTLGVGTDAIIAQFNPGSSLVTGSTSSIGEVVYPAADVALLNGGNTFSGNQTVNGTVTANSFTGSFSGNGGGLYNVTAAGLICTGCITNSQLGITYAAGDAQGGNALNALALNGLPSSAFAITGPGGNTFSGPQIVNNTITANGALSGTSAAFSGPLASASLALAPAGTATASQAFNSGPIDLPASLFNSSTGAAQNLLFRWQAEPAASTNNTPAPAATLNLLYGTAGSPSETGLSVNANGTINFVPAQTFPGMGTITGITTGNGVDGGGTSGNIYIGLASQTCAAGSALTALPYACSPFVAPGSSPTFGSVTAASFSGGSFSGNGSGLSGVNAATAAVATNALALGGNGPAYYATIASNSFTGPQSMPSLAVSGAASAASVTASGTVQGTSVIASGSLAGASLTIGGGTPITSYVSVTQSITLPKINSGACATFQTAALTGFTPGSSDSIALGIPGNLQAGLNSGRGPEVFLTYQAWETSSSANPTITLQICNPSSGYRGGATGTIRIDVFKH